MVAQLIFLLVFVSLPFWILVLRNLIWDVYLWQVKEYRVDRIMSQWVYERDKGMRSELLTMVKIALLTVAIMMFLAPGANELLIVYVLAFVIYWFEAFGFLQKLTRKKILRPNPRSLRNLLISLLVLVVLVVPYLLIFSWIGALTLGPNHIAVTDNNVLLNVDLRSILPRNVDGVTVLPAEYVVVVWGVLLGMITELGGTFIVALGVLLTWPLSFLKRKLTLSKAAVKLLKNKHVKVVAVTGSYGKSTTKELLYQLLEPDFKVIRTKKNNNTDIGIAQTILRDLRKDTEVFIAEMGAYKIGETRECCRIAKPDIAIITGVDQQHVSLFGGIRQVIESTYEVIEELKDDGLAILNGDNEYCVRMAEKTSKRKSLYTSDQHMEKYYHKPSLDESADSTGARDHPGYEFSYITKIVKISRGLKFNLRYANKDYTVTTNLQAVYNLSNLIAAVLVAHELGLPLEKIVKTINNIDFEVPYLNIYAGVNGSKILDDGYNTNPTGFLAALKFMDELKLKSRKWVLTQGLIELGPERAKTNADLAKEIVARADGLFTTDSFLWDCVKKADPEFEAILVDSVFDFPLYFAEQVKNNHIVLLEGAFPQEVLRQIYYRDKK
jgi:UDP-N-acetylmuramyl pentapeptide synthase